jgi:hypothetical protein
MGVYSLAAQGSQVGNRKRSWQAVKSRQSHEPSPFITTEGSERQWSPRRTTIFILLTSTVLWLCILFGLSQL